MAGLSDEFQGRLIIVWPKSSGLGLNSTAVKLIDADTGQHITSGVEMKVDATPGRAVTAELLMLVDGQDEPLMADAKPILAEDGEHVRTKTFRWFITEMRTAD